MRTTRAISTAVLATLVCAAGTIRAHHAGSMYETTPVWVTGTVVRFEPINPHTIITLEQQSADGQVRVRGIEGPGQTQLRQLGLDADAPKIGDTIAFCAFPYKSVEELSRMFPEVDFSARRSSPDTDGSAPQFIAGHVMVMPDGERRLWEPHGVIAECIRGSEEPRQPWLDFLDSDPRARQAWCQQRAYAPVRSEPSLAEFVEEINASLEYPCQ